MKWVQQNRLEFKLKLLSLLKNVSFYKYYLKHPTNVTAVVNFKVSCFWEIWKNFWGSKQNWHYQHPNQFHYHTSYVSNLSTREMICMIFQHAKRGRGQCVTLHMEINVDLLVIWATWEADACLFATIAGVRVIPTPLYRSWVTHTHTNQVHSFSTDGLSQSQLLFIFLFLAHDLQITILPWTLSQFDGSAAHIPP